MKSESKSLSVSNYKAGLLCLFLFFLIILPYYKVVSYDFVHLDDTVQLTINKHVLTGFTWENFLFSLSPESWCSPLTWFTYTLGHELFGLNPTAFHIMNLTFHIANSMLLFYVLMRMTGLFWQCATVGVLFALHPMNVETVAWVAELNNVLSCFFLLLTLLTYKLYTEKPSWMRYILCLSLFGLGLLAKPLLMTLPFVLFLLDLWPLNRISIKRIPDTEKFWQMISPGGSIQRIIYEKVPFLLLTFASLASNIFGANERMGIANSELIPLSLRVSNATVSYLKYLYKLFLPYNLAPLYTFPGSIPLWQVVGSVAILLLITALAFRSVSRYPYFLVGWLWFLGVLVPCLGIVQAGQWAEIADRYAYHSFIGLFIILSWGVPDLFRRWKQYRKLLAFAMILIVPALMALTWLQVRYWRDSITLFERIISISPNNYFPHFILANVLRDKGQPTQAINHFQRALSLEKRDPNVYLYLGQTYEAQKDNTKALDYYSQGISIDPQNVSLHMQMGSLLATLKRYDEATYHFKKVVFVNPKHVNALVQLGNTSLLTQDADEAIRVYSAALKIKPRMAHVHNNLGKAYVQKADITNAITCFKKALELDAKLGEARNNYFRAYNTYSDILKSISRIEHDLSSAQHNPSLYSQLGNLYRQKGDQAKALEAYEKALMIKKDHIPAIYGLSILYANRQEYQRSLDLLLNIRRIQPDNPLIYYNIACVYSRMNMTDESISWLKQSVDKGFRDWNMIRRDPDLSYIRKEPYVLELIRTN